MESHHSLSRRTALVRLGAGSVGAALAARGLAAGAQEATPADLPPVLVDWVAAFEALDLDAIVATHAEDGLHDDVPLGQLIAGREAIRSHLELLTTEFTDVSVGVTNVIATDAGGAAEWVFTGAYTGQVPGFPPGTGEQVAIRGASIFDLAGNLIQREAEYYDALGLLAQLGVVPPPPGGTPEVATPGT